MSDLNALSTAKSRGWDWGIHTSFCGAGDQIIARVRPAGAKTQGTPKLCATVSEAVAWISEMTREVSR